MPRDVLEQQANREFDLSMPKLAGYSKMLAVATMAGLFPSMVWSSDIGSAWQVYWERCNEALLAPRAAAAAVGTLGLSPNQYASSPDGKLFTYTIGTPDHYTLYYFNQVSDTLGTTCSSSVVPSSSTPTEIENFLKNSLNANVAGGLMPVIWPSGPSSFQRADDSYTWIMEMPALIEKGASVHVQYQSGTVTITGFGEEK